MNSFISKLVNIFKANENILMFNVQRILKRNKMSSLRMENPW